MGKTSFAIMIDKEIISLLRKLLLLSCILLGLFFLSENAVAQVTSVSQLTDVKPHHWAFQTLQSLAERYGCIAPSSDSTFKGDFAITRYELVTIVSYCLDRWTELSASGASDFHTDIDERERLQDTLEALGRELIAQQDRLKLLENSLQLLEKNK